MARPQPIQIPTSYASLPLEHIKISHVPASSPAATPVILLTLNRPAKNNAFTDLMMKEIEASYKIFDLDERVKCIVMTGAGRMFCAGADLEIGFPGSSGKGSGGTRRIKEKDQDHRDG
jgi:enoyl-CoA hydratase/carnithine racemase